LDLFIETIGRAEGFENDRATRSSPALEFIIASDPGALHRVINVALSGDCASRARCFGWSLPTTDHLLPPAKERRLSEKVPLGTKCF
jgi:hypothetical protein